MPARPGAAVAATVARKAAQKEGQGETGGSGANGIAAAVAGVNRVLPYSPSDDDPVSPRGTETLRSCLRDARSLGFKQSAGPEDPYTVELTLRARVADAGGQDPAAGGPREDAPQAGGRVFCFVVKRAAVAEPRRAFSQVLVLTRAVCSWSEAAPEASGRAHLLRRFHDHGDLSPDQPGDQSINQDHWILGDPDPVWVRTAAAPGRRCEWPARWRRLARHTSALPAAARPARYAQPATLLPASALLPNDFDQHNVLYRS